ncbi:predicted protein [Postia placenta Mad-698-R]|uniref:Uncharacterized protein n=1 Tax=Postia placenta MAD-698-R-SB12 TaxID=670580 RepID=A0A1X6MLB3_9APHY|nr:hypothetical protein POSPLADRAFT_1050325 [Postia placenta MAD-698-R-SB12]EED82126.1 predicted protein [Postia placenta Mad-698-R]OSX56873.1 hypothetical protein POSPLADRAFT_1050325 [Postia placenta MAD-698-R-SB12]
MFNDVVFVEDKGRPLGQGPVRRLYTLEVAVPSAYGWEHIEVPRAIPSVWRRAIQQTSQPEGASFVWFDWIGCPPRSGVRLLDVLWGGPDRARLEDRLRGGRVMDFDCYPVRTIELELVPELSYYGLVKREVTLCLEEDLDIQDPHGPSRAQLAVAVAKTVDSFLHVRLKSTVLSGDDVPPCERRRTVLEVFMANGINYDDIIIVGISGYNQTCDKPTFRILLDAWMHRPSQELTATNASSVVSPLYRFMRVSVDDRPRSALIPRRIPHRRTLDQWDFESSSQTDYGIIPDIRFDWIGRDGEGMHMGDVIHYYADILGTLMRDGACAPLQEWEDLDEIELDGFEYDTTIDTRMPVREGSNAYSLARIVRRTAAELIRFFRSMMQQSAEGIDKDELANYCLVHEAIVNNQIIMTHLSHIGGSIFRVNLETVGA